MALIIVNSALDNTIAGDGFTTLREAVLEANADAAGDTIVFDASLQGSTITLSSGQLIINNDVSIDGDTNGDNKADITIDGGGQRILKIVESNFLGAYTDVDLKSLTLSNGVATQAGGGDDGGAIYVGNNVGSLDVLDTTFYNNSATFGGGALHVQSGVVTIVNSLFNGNTAGVYGGAIRGMGGDINIINSTLSGNTTNGTGGGIIMQDGNLVMTNSTVTLNRADSDGANISDGGGLFAGGFATATINNTVISGNTSGSANAANDLSGTVTLNSSFIGGNAQLGSLQDNGGTVATHAPILGSPLVNGGSNALLPADTLDVDGDGNTAEILPLDGRGLVRNGDGTVDIGAVESPDYLVTTAADVVNANDGVLSLREALNAANGNADANNIFFAATLDNSTITLGLGDLDITQGTVTIHGDIEGDGQLDIKLSGGGAGGFGFFNITGATTNVVIDSLNMVDGFVEQLPGSGNGDAAYAISNAGTLTLSNSQIANTIVIGAAGDAVGLTDGSYSGGNAAIISSSGTLNIVDTIIRNSTAIAGAGSLGANGEANASAYNGDTGGAGGHGAVIISSGILNLQNSLFDNVSVTAGAGGQGGNGVSYVGPLETYNGRGGNGGRGGDADLIRNAGTVGGEFGLTNSSFTFGFGGGFGNGIYGSPNGNPGSPGLHSLGIRNIGGGTSVGVDDHAAPSLIFNLTTGVDEIFASTATIPANVIWGMNSNDVLNGFEGNDDIAGGAGNDQLNGGADNDTIEGGAGNDIMDGGTNTAAGDTLTFAGFRAAPGTTQGITVDLGYSAQQNTGAGLDTITGFENVIGSDFNDTIIGSSGINIIRGGLGNDTLFIDSSFADVAGEVFDGGDGDDTLAFGGYGSSIINLRNDTVSSIQAFRVTDPGFGASTTIQLNANQFSPTGIALNAVMNLDVFGDTSEIFDITMGTATALNLSGLTFTGITSNTRFLITGDSSIENITGSSLNDTINAGAGVDIVNSGAGNDTVNGGAGGDTLNGGANGAGGDTVTYQTSATGVTVNLFTNINTNGDAAGDNLSGFENVTGSALADNITGNTTGNILNGGADLVSDILSGGLGNDTYIINTSTDLITEFVASGTADVVQASVSFTLANDDYIDIMQTTNAALTTAINLTGNAIRQVITGNAGANILNGGVDVVSDTLSGGLGNDTYIINTSSDLITEFSNGGTADVVKASVSFTLANDDYIDIMQTTDAALTTAINLTGNAIRQVITGNAGVNILNGGVDVVSDTLAGGLGNDTYIINTSTDLITEFSNGGLADVVQASVSFTLANDDYIETLQTTNAALTTAINLTGNALTQAITGNAGANILNGMFGNDTLTGGLGADSFLFNSTLSAASNRDVITDFNIADDTIQLENTGIFTALGAALGVLDINLFKNLTTGGPVDATDRILYDDVTGALSYDADGNGIIAAIQFATLTGSPTITNADFFVV